jgi:SAM-dependent methyltransferase
MEFDCVVTRMGMTDMAEHDRERAGVSSRLTQTCVCADGGPLWAEGDGSQGILRCSSCDLLMRQDPQRDDFTGWYEQHYWQEFFDEQQGLARSNLWTHIMNRIERLMSGRGLLVDVGCGGGALLSHCRDRGWNGIGFELSQAAVRSACAQGLDVRRQGWPPCPLPDATVQAVTCVNVLDHLSPPCDALQEMWRILRPGGLLYLRVSNAPLHVGLSNITRRLQLPDLTVMHRYGFGKRSLHIHLHRLGFRKITVRTSPPTQADAYRQGDGFDRPLRRVCKQTDRFLYRIAKSFGLDRLAWGLSLEATAVKPVGAGARVDG